MNDIGTRHGAVEKTRPSTDFGEGVGEGIRGGDATREGDAWRALDADVAAASL